MKRLINFLVTLLFSIIILSSCMTTNKAYQSSTVICRDVQIDPIKADVNIDENNKLKGESSASYFLIFRLSGDNTYADGIVNNATGGFLNSLNPFSVRLNKVRAAAAYNALKSNGNEYDVFVHPTYTVTSTNFLNIYQGFKVQVEGYGAKYENFRTEKQKIVMFENGKEIILQDDSRESVKTTGNVTVVPPETVKKMNETSFKIGDKVDLTDLLDINGEQTDRKIFGAEIYDISDETLFIRYKFMGETHEVQRNYKTVTRSR